MEWNSPGPMNWKVIQCIDKHWWCFFHFKHKELDKCPSKGFKEEQSYPQRSTSCIWCRDLCNIEWCNQKKAAEKQEREREQERGKIEAGRRQGRQSWMLHRRGKVWSKTKNTPNNQGGVHSSIPRLSQRCKDSKKYTVQFHPFKSTPGCVPNNQKLSQGSQERLWLWCWPQRSFKQAWKMIDSTVYKQCKYSWRGKKQNVRIIIYQC